MSSTIHLRPGQQLQLPVSAEHPLAQYQSVRVATRQELLKHPVYSRIIEFQICALQNQKITERGLAAKVSNEEITSIINGVIARIGSVWQYTLTDIIVESGARLTFHGNYHVVTAGNVLIEDGGTIRVYCDDPTISATLGLTCVQLAGPSRPIIIPRPLPGGLSNLT